ncbi:MAG: response regulator, partial [Nitrospirae bacterium]
IHDKDFRIVRANRALLEFLGMSEDEIRGKHCYEIFHKRNEPWPECPHSSTLKEKRPVDTEVDDPNIGVPLLISCSPIYDEKGEITGTVHIAKDITRLRKMEEELLRAKNLESLGYVAGGIAHDFNNLLTGILGNIAMAGLKLREPLEAERHLNTAERACEQARELTGKLLVFAEGGIPNREEVDLRGLIKDLVLLYLDPKLYKTEVSLSGGVTVVGDREFIRKAFSAIILNAREAMPDGGEFKVFDKVEEMEEGNIYGLAPGRYLRISLSDTGKGIESGIMGKIFDPYFTTKPMDYRKGTGLGLATAFSAIKKHGGTITVESEVGGGATFHVYLPVGVSEKGEKKGEGSRPKVLLVDDEKVVRDVASEMLSALGIEVFTAASGEEGVEILKEQREVDLAIIDLTVRRGSGGVEALKILKGVHPTLRAIATTGLLSAFERENLLSKGFQGVLEKPFGLKELKRALEDAGLC